MKRVRIISLFLFLLMTIQMLPIEKIGRMLYQNQWTEELPHHAETGKAEITEVFSTFIPPLTNNYISVFKENIALAYIHLCERIPSNHSTDIVSPPPDVAS